MLRSVAAVLNRSLGRHGSKGLAFHSTCNICGYAGYFRAAGRPRRAGARCPQCGSAERHRLLMLWLTRNAEMARGLDMLHFAPEKSCSAMLRTRVARYRSADIVPGRADLVLNIESITLPDASVGCIVCSHVLEHVDDRKALAEMHRILRPGGLALIMVPVIEGWAKTYENPNVMLAEDRARHYGQSDHLRYYGADVRDRIRGSGFVLEEFTAEGEDVLTYALSRGEKVFIGRRLAVPGDPDAVRFLPAGAG